MKVLAKLMVATMMVLAANPILAMEDNSLETLVSVKALEPGKVQVAYYGKSPEKIHISIYNEKEKAVFKETVKSKKGVKIPYNLKELPYGEYKFKVRVDDEITVHKVKHEAPLYPGNVKIQATAFGDGKIKMMITGPGHKEFKLRIYDDHNRLLFQQDVDQNENYGKVFNLKQLEAKSVQLVLSNRNEILQKEIVNL